MDERRAVEQRNQPEHLALAERARGVSLALCVRHAEFERAARDDDQVRRLRAARGHRLSVDEVLQVRGVGQAFDHRVSAGLQPRHGGQGLHERFGARLHCA
ncbi:hypothetical protein D9M72_581170 [compost metagenome]